MQKSGTNTNLRSSTRNNLSSPPAPYVTPPPSRRHISSTTPLDSDTGNASPRTSPASSSDRTPSPSVSTRADPSASAIYSLALPSTLGPPAVSDPNQTLLSIWSKYRAFAPARAKSQVSHIMERVKEQPKLIRTAITALLKDKSTPDFRKMSQAEACEYLARFQPILSDTEKKNLVDVIFQLQPGWLKMHRNIAEVESILGRLPSNLSNISSSELVTALHKLRQRLHPDEVACVLQLNMGLNCGEFAAEVKEFDEKQILHKLMSLLWASDGADNPETPLGASFEARAGDWLKQLKEIGQAESQPTPQQTPFKRKKLSRSNRATVHRGKSPLTTSLASSMSLAAIATAGTTSPRPNTTTTTTTTSTLQAARSHQDEVDDAQVKRTSSTLETPRNSSRRSSVPKFRALSPRSSEKSAKTPSKSRNRHARTDSMFATSPRGSSRAAKNSERVALPQAQESSAPPSDIHRGSMPARLAPDDFAPSEKVVSPGTISKRKQLQPRRRSMKNISKPDLSGMSPEAKKTGSRISEKRIRDEEVHDSGSDKQRRRQPISKSSTSPRARPTDESTPPKPPRALKIDLLALQSQLAPELGNSSSEDYPGQFRKLLKTVFNQLPDDVNLNQGNQTLEILQNAIATAGFTEEQRRIFRNVARSFAVNPSLLGTTEGGEIMRQMIRLISVLLQQDISTAVLAAEKS